jgi:hypothetical protein
MNYMSLCVRKPATLKLDRHVILAGGTDNRLLSYPCRRDRQQATGISLQGGLKTGYCHILAGGTDSRLLSYPCTRDWQQATVISLQEGLTTGYCHILAGGTGSRLLSCPCRRDWQQATVISLQERLTTGYCHILAGGTDNRLLSYLSKVVIQTIVINFQWANPSRGPVTLLVLLVLVPWRFGPFSGQGLPDLIPPFSISCWRLPVPYLRHSSKQHPPLYL